MTPEDNKAVLKAQEEQILQHLARLSQNGDFTAWRDLVCKPMLEILERRMDGADSMSEVEFRASYKHYRSLRYLFEEIFDTVAFQLQDQKDQATFETQLEK